MGCGAAVRPAGPDLRRSADELRGPPGQAGRGRGGGGRGGRIGSPGGRGRRLAYLRLFPDHIVGAEQVS